MFQVSRQDKRLRNKDEVLVMKLGNREPVAISSAFLRRTPVFHYQGVVVLTTPEGANRVYASGGVQFRSFADNKVLDSAGRSWLVTEDGLKAEIGDRVLTRQPAHRAFWFAWFAQFPDTALVK
jgi:hypothetical protein